MFSSSILSSEANSEKALEHYCVEFFSNKAITNIDSVLLYIENKKASGGCDTISHSMNPTRRILTVEYENADAKKRVIEKKVHTFQDFIFYANPPLDKSKFLHNPCLLVFKGFEPSALSEIQVSLLVNLVVNDDDDDNNNLVIDSSEKIERSKFMLDVIYVKCKRPIDEAKLLDKMSDTVSNEISFVRGYVTNTIAIEVPERNEDFVEFYLKELRETMDFDETIQRRGSFVYVTFKSERECADFLGKEHKCGQDTLRVEYIYNFDLFETEVHKEEASQKIRKNLSESNFEINNNEFIQNNENENVQLENDDQDDDDEDSEDQNEDSEDSEDDQDVDDEDSEDQADDEFNGESANNQHYWIKEMFQMHENEDDDECKIHDKDKEDDENDWNDVEGIDPEYDEQADEEEVAGDYGEFEEVEDDDEEEEEEEPILIKEEKSYFENEENELDEEAYLGFYFENKPAEAFGFSTIQSLLKPQTLRFTRPFVIINVQKEPKLKIFKHLSIIFYKKFQYDLKERETRCETTIENDGSIKLECMRELPTNQDEFDLLKNEWEIEIYSYLAEFFGQFEMRQLLASADHLNENLLDSIKIDRIRCYAKIVRIDTIELIGFKDAVEEAEQTILEQIALKIKSIDETKVDYSSSSHLPMLQKIPVDELFVRFFTEKEKLVAEWLNLLQLECVVVAERDDDERLNKSTLSVYSTNRDHLNAFTELINTELESFVLDESLTESVSERTFNEFVNELNTNEDVVFSMGLDGLIRSVKICGFKERIEEIYTRFLNLSSAE